MSLFFFNEGRKKCREVTQTEPHLMVLGFNKHNIPIYGMWVHIEYCIKTLCNLLKMSHKTHRDLVVASQERN